VMDRIAARAKEPRVSAAGYLVVGHDRSRPRRNRFLARTGYSHHQFGSGPQPGFEDIYPFSSKEMPQ
jgi:hypothetical protein